MELLLLLIVKTMPTITLLGIVSLCEVLFLKRERLRSKLRKQGISGPPPSFLLGNTRDAEKKIQSKPSKAPWEEEQIVIHNYSSTLFPFYEQCRKEYRPIFRFSLANMQLLYIDRPDVVREISMCTSLDLGKPSYQRKELGPLLGQGILTSNGAIWAHQRKTLAPELYPQKVKGMTNLMVESSITLLNSWNDRIESEGGIADIEVGEYMRSLSGDVIARACFGSNYSKGKEIFFKLKAIQRALSNKGVGWIRAMRYLPTKSNKEIWALEKEVRSLILKAVKERKETTPLEKDLLQIILESATNSGLGKTATQRLIVDNCKNIYAAANDATALSASWSLMLLASNPEWQDRVRTEVIEICRGQLPDADMVRQMKTLTMILYESLRLYPPGPFVSREALQDINIGEIYVPKGVIVRIPSLMLHHDPEIWGPDADEFNPERFANGVKGACKLPYVYMPFGVGPRKCLGQNFAMAELKILLALVVSNFSLSLSPKYRHSPAQRLVIEPEHGVNLLIRRL
ncbi:hypothetical protein L1049_011520 [Liquidambar formosana]|uniref:Cytochrome P450 n=1 Tax=Liquidambar formosana TaxID=63359 RepID=A0AAP0WX32_LIQFO